MLLSAEERAELIRLIERGAPLPEHYRARLFPAAEQAPAGADPGSLLQLLDELASELVQHPELPQMLERCLQAALAASGSECGGIYLVDSGGLHLACQAGLPAEFAAAVAQYPPDDRHTGIVMRGEVCEFSHGALDEGSPEAAAGFQAVLAIPIHYDGRAVACLNLASWAKAQYNATERRAAHAIAAQAAGFIARATMRSALRESEERFDAAFQRNPSWLALIELATQKVVDVNAEWCLMTGYSREEAVGRSLAELELFSQQVWDTVQAEALAKGSVRNVEGRIRIKDGSYRTLLVAREIIQLAGVPHLLAMGVDITERKLTEEALAVASERLELAQTVAGVGVWDWDIVSGSVEWSAQMYTLFGLDPQMHHASFELWRSVLHESDATVAEQRITQALRDHTDLSSDYRIRLPDGSVRWINAAGKAQYDATGAPTRMLGICMDITERKQIEQALRHSEERYRGLYENVQVGIVETTPDGRLLSINPAFANLLGYDSPAQMQAKVQDVTQVYAYPVQRQRLLEQLRAPGDRSSTEVELVCRDGTHIYGLLLVRAARWQDGAQQVLESSCIDITARKHMEEELRESEQCFHAAFMYNPSWLVLTHLETQRTVDVNQEWTKIFGWTREEAVGRTVAELGIYSQATIDRFMAELRATGAVRNLEAVATTRDGTQHVVLVSRELVTIAGEQHMLSMGIDITERKTTEEALRLSEERYRFLTENISDVVWVFDLELMRFTYVSPSVVRLRGYTAEEIMGQDLMASMTTASAAHAEQVLPERIKAFLADPARRQVYYDEIEQPCKDGSTVQTEIASYHHLNEATGHLETIGVSRDITERKQTEAALRDSEQRYRFLMENISDVVWVLDMDEMRFTYISPSILRVRGYTADEVLQQRLDEALTPESYAKAMAFLPPRAQEFAADPAVQHVYYDDIDQWRRDGSVVHTEIASYFRRNTATGHLELLGATRDITERKQVEAALRDSEQRYRELFEHMTPGFALHEIILDEALRPCDYRFLEVNPAFEQLTGLLAEDLLGHTVLEIMPQTESYWIEAYGKVALTGEAMRIENYSAELGHYYDVLAYSPQPGQFATVITDITERKQAEAALRRNEHFLRAVVEHSPLGISVRNNTGRLLSYNAAWRQIWAIPQAEIEQDMARERDNLKLDDRDDYAGPWWDQLKRVYKEGGTLSIAEARTHSRRPGAAEWVAQLFYAIPGADGAVERVVVLTQDITERKRAEAEMQLLQQQFMQSQKMEVVGRLAGGVAHDFNNKLQLILGYAELAQNEVAPGSQTANYLSEVLEAARGSHNLTRQLLAFARQQPAQPQVLDVNATITGMLKMLRRLIGENIELEWLPGPGLPPVMLDPVQMDQLLANLAVNSRDAIEGAGTITIQTRRVESGPDSAEAGVELVFADTGCGMEPDVLEHIFEPFYTTKPVGQGTGLGLATVYGIVQQNSGQIKVESAPGQGATLSIILPACADSTSPAAAAAGAETAPRGAETVLVVEDDPIVMRLAVRILDNHGYHTLQTSEPQAALRLLDSYGGPVHLLLTDVVMPQMNGRELAELGRVLRPELKVLYMSGYTADIISKQGLLSAGVNLLHKPFTPSTLAQKVREVLDD